MFGVCPITIKIFFDTYYLLPTLGIFSHLSCCLFFLEFKAKIKLIWITNSSLEKKIFIWLRMMHILIEWFKLQTLPAECWPTLRTFQSRSSWNFVGINVVPQLTKTLFCFPSSKSTLMTEELRLRFHIGERTTKK